MRRPPWRGALALALASDAVSFGLQATGLGLAVVPQVALDLATAVGLALLIRPRWGLLAPLALEAFPGTAAFPAWAVAVAVWAALEPGDAAEE